MRFFPRQQLHLLFPQPVVSVFMVYLTTLILSPTVQHQML